MAAGPGRRNRNGGRRSDPLALVVGHSGDDPDLHQELLARHRASTVVRGGSSESSAYSSDVPASSRIAVMLSRTRLVWAAMSPPVGFAVAGSRATCPATNTQLP